MRMSLCFQVANVKKPLIAVKRIVEKGNKVHFGPGVGDNFIQNVVTGDRLPLRPNGRGSYLLDIAFVGGNMTEVTVDSGAEENVCPKECGDQFKIDSAPALYLRDASGNEIRHWGQRDVLATSSF